jgi:excisionase family DNA binding protein
METTEKKDLMTREEVQHLLQVSGVTLTKYTRSGRLSFYKLGRRILFDRQEILKEVKTCKSI